MENIIIPMEEYKELLMIKGKYEELKSQQVKPILVREPKIAKDYEPPIELYTTICGLEEQKQ